MGIAISDPSGEDLHRRGQRCSHSKALVQGVRCDPSAGTAPAHCAMLASRWPVKQQSRQRAPRLTALPSSPIRTAFLGGNR
jgi:hypothetical protein